MNNLLYEQNYTKVVEPLYGNKRNSDDAELVKNITDPHQYTIPNEERIDMTSYDTFSVDPIGCKDADDAFSIYTNNNNLYLAIHIADPTEYIKLHSKLWIDIVNRTTTKYPSNRPPIHMMPSAVLELSSLQGSIQGNLKKAITVLTEISTETFEPIKEIQLLFTTILVKKENAYSYYDASENIDRVNPFKLGLKISEALKKIRSTKTKGVKLNELSTAYPIYEEDTVYLYKDTPNEKLMKQMIAELAIFANSFVGEYLKINLNTGIFRTCSASDWLQTIYSEISGEDLLKEIITNGIRAEYMSTIESHDLVGMPEYCHFTSPIRRLSDCVCHYLLKYIYFKNKDVDINIPFCETKLDELASTCLYVTKKEKKNQYLDIKFRLLQVMHNLILVENKIKIGFYITNYRGAFLNIIICRINDYNVHMSYTLRTHDYKKEINPKNIDFIEIIQVNCFTKFDQNTIPELDRYILS